MTATIMIVTYNRLALTTQTLDNLFKTTKYPYNLIFVDNNSTDGTVEFLSDTLGNKVKECESFKKYSIILNTENKGIAIGRNQSLLAATKVYNSEWLVTFDNDVLVPDGWLTEAIDILKVNKQYASIGVNFENKQFPIIKLNDKEFQHKAQGNLGTACMVFNKTLQKMLGYFNYKDYGKYGEEDADWGMRTRVIGFKLGYIKENGKHLGEGEHDTGKYREFKTASHTKNLVVFNANCGAYAKHKKSLYIDFGGKD
ncbi:MAG: glycosyltransferase [bacterium]|nr:glycosyltransferase [bacterium]